MGLHLDALEARRAATIANNAQVVAYDTCSPVVWLYLSEKVQCCAAANGLSNLSSRIPWNSHCGGSDASWVGTVKIVGPEDRARTRHPVVIESTSTTIEGQFVRPSGICPFRRWIGLHEDFRVDR